MALWVISGLGRLCVGGQALQDVSVSEQNVDRPPEPMAARIAWHVESVCEVVHLGKLAPLPFKNIVLKSVCLVDAHDDYSKSS